MNNGGMMSRNTIVKGRPTKVLNLFEDLQHKHMPKTQNSFV